MTWPGPPFGLFAAASVWCGLSRGPEELILARAVQGDMPAALTLLRQELENFPENDRARGIYADLLAAYPA